MKKTFFAIVFFLILCFSITSVNAQKSNYVLLYQDEFNDDSLNTNNWYYRDSEELCFGGYNQKENISVETSDGIGYLKIEYNEWDINGDSIVDKVGGGVISKRAFGYGYYEARIKFYNNERGLHQSFWTTGAGYYNNYSAEYKYNEDAKNEIVPWVNSALEIDGIELNSDYDFGSANFHWHQPQFVTPSGANRNFSTTYMNLNNWITVAFEWKPGVVIYYIDGVERHRFTYTDNRYAPQEVWLTALANTQDFFGGGGTPEAGASMKIDYFRYYGDNSFNSNLIGNFSFESNNQNSEVPFNWIQSDGIYNNLYSDESKVVFDTTAFNGQGYLKHNCKTSSNVMTTKQQLDYIPNGSYKLSAWVKSSGGLNLAKMRAVYGMNEMNVDIPESANWTRIVIDSIDVTSHNITIAFSTTGTVGKWIEVDNVELVAKSFDKPFELPALIVHNEDPEYSEVGTWLSSGLTGYNGTSTRYAGKTIGPCAQWTPNILTASDYNVYIYKIVDSSSDTNAKIDIEYNGGNETKYLDYSVGTSGWVYLGTYNFAAGNSGYVRNSLNTSGKYIRTDAIKLEKIDLIIDNGDTSYSEYGNWFPSSLVGYNGTSTKYAGSTIGPYAQWTPSIVTASDYNVYIYKIVNTSSDSNAKIDIVYNGGDETKYLDYSTGTSGWVYLGTYNFVDGTSGYVRNSLNTSGKYIRADAVYFEQTPVPLFECDGRFNIGKSVTKTDSVINKKSINKMIISPNPTTDHINVEIDGNKDNLLNIKLIDIRGTVLKSFNFRSESNSFIYKIDVNDLKSGIYILEIEENSVISINKIFKK